MTAQEGHPDTLNFEKVCVQDGAIILGDLSGLVFGDVLPGSVIRGNSDLVVEGQVQGTKERPTVIEILGEVEIEEGASNARIQATNIILRGNAEACQMQAHQSIEVHGNVKQGQVLLGATPDNIKALHNLQVEEQSARNMLRELDTTLHMNARRFIRDYPHLNFQIGTILVPMEQRLHVDLSSFYHTQKGKDNKKIDENLQNFFLKIVVGKLTASNRLYLSQSPLRPKLFMKLVEDLKQHVKSIRERDKLNAKIDYLSKKSSEIFESYRNAGESLKFRVGGTVGEGTTVQFAHMQRFQESSLGLWDIESLETAASVISLKDGNGLGLEIQTEEGAKSLQEAKNNRFFNGVFTSTKKTILWQAR